MALLLLLAAECTLVSCSPVSVGSNVLDHSPPEGSSVDASTLASLRGALTGVSAKLSALETSFSKLTNNIEKQETRAAVEVGTPILRATALSATATEPQATTVSKGSKLDALKSQKTQLEIQQLEKALKPEPEKSDLEKKVDEAELNKRLQDARLEKNAELMDRKAASADLLRIRASWSRTRLGAQRRARASW